MLKVMALGNRGNRLTLILALLLGVLAAALTAVYLSSAGGDGGDSAGAPVIETTPAVVAAEEIAAGTRITAEMVSVKAIPLELALPDLLAQSEDVVGKVALVAIVPGEQVVASRVTAVTDEGQVLEAQSIADAIPLAKPPATCEIDNCGQRAASVAVEPFTSSGGQILPGDRVDVVLAFQDGGAITIIQDVEVLSIDQEILKVITVPATEEEAENRSQVSESEENPEATTATLAVWPDEAQILTAGEEYTERHKMTVFGGAAAALSLPDATEFDCEGSVRLVLRHEGQQGPVPLVTSGTCATLFAYIWGLS
jgi:pilus assembly protein CpaB